MLRQVIKAAVVVGLTLVAIETILKVPYSSGKRLIRKTLLQWSPPPTVPISTCGIEARDDIPANSVLIVGHSYGSPGTTGEFIAPTVENLIRNNAENLDAVVLSGDVFRTPSASKWQRLSTMADEIGVDVHIAPGNHDVGVGDNSQRDVWEQSPFRLASTPDVLNLAGFAIVLEDSVKNGWQLDPEVMDVLNGIQQPAQRLLIRHNIAVSEMLDVSNSKAGFDGNLPTAQDFSGMFPKGTTIISGDSGAFPSRPRISCLSVGGVDIIANGIGELPDDTVLIANDGKLFRAPLVKSSN